MTTISLRFKFLFFLLLASNLAVVGSDGNDYMNLNIDRSSDLTGDMTLSMGAGNDSLGSARFKNGDSVDMGSGDDSIGLYVTNSSGTPAYASLSMVKLDGGSGTDTLDFGNMGTQGSTELTLTGGGATNFENIDGGVGDNIIRGDASVNVLRGNRSTDTIYGGSGDDILSGSTAWSSSNDSDSNRQDAANDFNNDTDDKLYGEAGNDLLIGTIGDNTLDGGTGTDTVYSGNGLDTIVTRTGDGGSSLSDADVVVDFTDGSDIVGLSGLNYSDLTVQQGTGSYSSHVVVQETSTGEFLMIIQNQNISNINDNDFSAI